MKNEEEPSHDSTRRLSRPGQAAAAPSEKPSSSLFPEMMMEAIVDPANMQRAWDQVRGNRGAPGPDGITLTQFPEWLRPQWAAIRQQLLDGTYEPSPVRRKTIDKPDGGQQQLGIPNALGRLIQQAIQQVLTPVFDPGFWDRATVFDRVAPLMEQPSRCNGRSAEAAASSWTWTCRSSLTGSSTMS